MRTESWTFPVYEGPAGLLRSPGSSSGAPTERPRAGGWRSAAHNCRCQCRVSHRSYEDLCLRPLPALGAQHGGISRWRGAYSCPCPSRVPLLPFQAHAPPPFVSAHPPHPPHTYAPHTHAPHSHAHTHKYHQQYTCSNTRVSPSIPQHPPPRQTVRPRLRFLLLFVLFLFPCALLTLDLVSLRPPRVVLHLPPPSHADPRVLHGLL